MKLIVSINKYLPGVKPKDLRQILMNCIIKEVVEGILARGIKFF